MLLTAALGHYGQQLSAWRDVNRTFRQPVQTYVYPWRPSTTTSHDQLTFIDVWTHGGETRDQWLLLCWSYGGSHFEKKKIANPATVSAFLWFRESFIGKAYLINNFDILRNRIRIEPNINYQYSRRRQTSQLKNNIEINNYLKTPINDVASKKYNNLPIFLRKTNSTPSNSFMNVFCFDDVNFCSIASRNAVPWQYM